MLSHDSTTYTEFIVGQDILITAPRYKCGHKTKVTIIGSLGISDDLEVRDLKTSKITPCTGGTITINGLLNVIHNAKICNLSALDVYLCSGDTIYFHSKIAVAPSVPKLGINSFATIKAQDHQPIPNISLVIQPKGTGALVTTEPDGTAIGGNNRGENAVDLQMVRDSAMQVASGDLSTIGGGSGNTSSNTHSVVSGGNGNVASEVDSTVSGGTINTASGGASTVGGGQNNIASSSFATISGGVGNRASGSNSTIGGGQNNVVSNTFATVGGGNGNIVSGGASTISGGQDNIASGNFATIPGGSDCQAIHNNTYLWGTNTTISGAINQVVYNLRPAAYPAPALSETFIINGDLVVTGNVSFLRVDKEAPKPDLIYRGTVQLVKGKINIDIDSITGMTDTAFSKLIKNPQIHLTNRSNPEWIHLDNYEALATGKFTIISNNNESNAIVDWLVIAERNTIEIDK